jgi:hypothetical protein
MKRALLVLAALWLLGSYPGGVFPGRASGGSSGGGVNPAAISLSITLDDDSAPAPVSPVITVRVVGYFGSGRFHYTCSASEGEQVTPTTFGTEVTGGTEYVLDTVCGPYTTAAAYTITVWLERAGVVYDDTATLTVTPAPGQVRVALVAPLEPTCVLPCADQELVGFAYNGTTSYTWKADTDDSCAAATTACSDACWETTLDTGAFMDVGVLPDFVGAGIKVVRTCVLDEVPSSAFYQVQFEAQSASSALEITAAADPATSAGPTLDNVALEVGCTGGTCAQGCNVSFDCDKASAAGGGSTLNTNEFETTGADGCDDATSSTGTTSCAGGTAQVGTGAGTTNAIFFHNAWTSEAEQFIAIDDMTILTDSSNANQNRFNLRDDATNKYVLQTASPSTNSLRLTCPGNSCTTAAGQYVDGSPVDLSIHVVTATGRARLLDSAGEELCVCEGTAAADVDGYVLNGGQAIVSFSGVEVTTPGAGSDPTPLTANTTWPYNTEDEATENCDGYTAGTTTAQVIVSCPDAETRTLDIPIQVTVAATFDFAITGLAGSVPINDAFVTEFSIGSFTGTATGAVSAIGCSMATGQADETLPTATSTSGASFALAADGGWAGFEYTTTGTKTVTCHATRQGITAAKSANITVLDIVTPVVDLLVVPTFTQRNTTPGGNPTADTVCLSDSSGTAVAFTCAESDPSSIVTPSALTGTTPACLTRTFTANTKPAGTYRHTLACVRDGDVTDTATAIVDVIVSAPSAGDPAWFLGRDGSNRPLIASGTSLGTLTMHRVRNKPKSTLANPQTGVETINGNFIASYSENALIYHSTWDRMNGVPVDTDCIPMSECGNGAGKESDVLHMPWGNSMKSNVFIVVNNHFRGAVFRDTTCTSSGTCPHSDVIQGLATFSCPAQHWAMINNLVEDSDSGQQIHWSQWTDGDHAATPTACDLKTVLIQGNTFRQTAGFSGTGCPARGVGSYTGTRSCNKIHVNVPNNGGQPGNEWNIWCVANTGGIKGGSTSDPMDSGNRVVRVPPCSTSFVGTPVYVDYPTVEAAIAGELAAGKDIPPGLAISCKGWGTPPAGCTNFVGDPD